jgi:hypothetical protein
LIGTQIKNKKGAHLKNVRPFLLTAQNVLNIVPNNL